MPYFYSSGLQNTRGSFFLVTNMFPAILTLTFRPPFPLPLPHTATTRPTATLSPSPFMGHNLSVGAVLIQMYLPAADSRLGLLLVCWLVGFFFSFSLLTVRRRSPGSSFESVFRWVPAETVQVLPAPLSGPLTAAHCGCRRFVHSQISIWIRHENSSLVLLAFYFFFKCNLARIWRLFCTFIIKSNSANDGLTQAICGRFSFLIWPHKVEEIILHRK